MNGEGKSSGSAEAFSNEPISKPLIGTLKRVDGSGVDEGLKQLDSLITVKLTSLIGIDLIDGDGHGLLLHLKEPVTHIGHMAIQGFVGEVGKLGEVGSMARVDSCALSCQKLEANS